MIAGTFETQHKKAKAIFAASAKRGDTSEMLLNRLVRQEFWGMEVRVFCLCISISNAACV